MIYSKDKNKPLYLVRTKSESSLKQYENILRLPFPLVNKPKKTTRIQEITTKSPVYMWFEKRGNLKGGKLFLAKKRSVDGIFRILFEIFF